LSGKVKVGLTGVLVSITCPSDERLKVSIDCSELDNRRFMEFSERLQDLMLGIDADYSEKAMLKRSLDGRFTGRKKLEVVRRGKALKFSVVPSCFVNKIKNLKHDVYDELNFYAASKIVLVQAGRFKRCLYILSKSSISEYTRLVEGYNRELEELNGKIEKYLKSSSFREVVELVESYGLDSSPLKSEFRVEPIRLQQIPIELADYVIEEWERRDPVVAKYIKDMRSRIVRDAVESFKAKLKPILDKLSAERISERTLKRIREDLERIRGMSVEVGLSAVADSVITPLIEVVDNPEKFPEVFKSKENIGGEIDSRFESLLKRI